MGLKEFFQSTFFAVVIGLSALIVTLVYLRKFHFQISSHLRRRFMEKEIRKLENHFIVSGFGRVGSQVALELSHEKVPFVVIDRDPQRIEECKEKGFLSILGDAAIGEDVLKKAQIEKAKGLIIALGQDADALFVAVTAKSLNPSLFIVARASTEEGASKLEKVGVERVVLPYQIGGYHMANLALRPAVVDFLDLLVDTKHKELVAEEIEVKEEVKDLEDFLGQKKTNVVVLAIKKPDQSCLVNPRLQTILKVGDKLILLGTKEELEEIKKG